VRDVHQESGAREHFDLGQIGGVDLCGGPADLEVVMLAIACDQKIGRLPATRSLGWEWLGTRPGVRAESKSELPVTAVP
jgi:hypothetical protein